MAIFAGHAYSAAATRAALVAGIEDHGAVDAEGVCIWIDLQRSGAGTESADKDVSGLAGETICGGSAGGASGRTGEAAR